MLSPRRKLLEGGEGGIIILPQPGIWRETTPASHPQGHKLFRILCRLPFVPPGHWCIRWVRHSREQVYCLSDIFLLPKDLNLPSVRHFLF